MYKEELQKLRTDIAKSQGKNSYLVFNDEELEKLLEVKPKTMKELGSIKGFPKDGKRVATYGTKLISIFNQKLGMLGSTSVF